MYENKNAYFQGGKGVNEPSPKKKKYPIEKSIVVQPRFDKPFYKNFDLYDVESQDSTTGPGTGIYHSKEKDIKNFLEKRRKRNKYKAKDSWNNKKIKRKARTKLFYKIIKNAFHFTMDEYYNTPPISENSGAYVDSTGIGGYLDEYLPYNDLEGKSPSQLNFGRDYTPEQEELLKLINEMLNPKTPDLLFLNGFEPEEDLDPHNTINHINPYYQTTDLGNTVYDNMWI